MLQRRGVLLPTYNAYLRIGSTFSPKDFEWNMVVSAFVLQSGICLIATVMRNTHHVASMKVSFSNTFCRLPGAYNVGMHRPKPLLGGPVGHSWMSRTWVARTAVHVQLVATIS